MENPREVSTSELIEENLALKKRLRELEELAVNGPVGTELDQRLRIEEALADCSRLFAQPGEVDMDNILALIGNATGGHRACIYEFVENTLVANNTYEWCAPGVASKMEELKIIDLNMFPWSLSEIAQGRVVNIPDVSKLLPEARSESEILLRADIYSLVAVPVFNVKNILSAWMGFVDITHPRIWQEADIRLLQIVAEMLGTYWERRRAEEQVLHRLIVEGAIAEASRCFLQTEEANIYEIIELIGTAVKANRAYLFENNEETGLFDCTCEWCDPTTDSHISYLKDLDYASMEWWLNQLLNGEAIVIPQVDWMSAKMFGDSDIVSRLDAKSLVVVPIFGANHRPQAALGFDDVQGGRTWLEEDIRCLRMVGGMLGAYWERRKNEKALRHSEAMFRLLADITPAFTYITNMQPVNPLLYLNPAVSRLSGYSPEEIAAMNPWDIYHPEDKPMLVERGWARLRGEDLPQDYEVRFIKKDGSVGYGMLSSARIQWEGETALISVIHDISDQKNLLHKLTQARDQLELTVVERTSELIKVNKDLYMEINERKQIEQELRKSEANFKKLAEASPALIYVVDTENLLYINSAGENMTGYSREECLGKPYEYFIHEDYRDLLKKNSRDRREGKYIPPYELKLVHRDGTEKWGLLSGDVIEYEGVKCNIGAILDITEHKKMEEELMRKERLETLGLLAGGIAHDFNNILTVITGNASLGQMIWPGDEDDEIPHLLDDIKTAALQATHLTSQLLTFSKGGAPVKQSLAVQELVMEAVRFAMAGSNIKCIFSFSEDLWTIDVDREQMSQVINHLISNACQAMPQGGEIRLEISNQELAEPYLSLEPGKYVRISVIDQGHGIEESNLSKIFNPYYTTKESSRGMGLAVTESIVRRHGGSIEVKPNSKGGTIFSVMLPASKRSLYVSPLEEAKVLGGQGRILVMDDEEYIRIILGRMLKKLGYEAYMACDGQEAIDFYTRELENQQRFDAVIMDLTIPGGMGGSEAVQELLKIDPDLRAIVSSGYSSDPVMANYQEYGFCGVIPKPYEISKLNRVLREVLYEQSA